MTNDYVIDTYEYFCQEMRDKAIDELFYDDVELLADIIVDELGGDEREYAQDIISMGFRYAVYSQSDTAPEQKRDWFLKIMYQLILEAPFLDRILDKKLEDMWERGDQP